MTPKGAGRRSDPFNRSQEVLDHGYSVSVPAGEWGVLAMGFRYGQYYVITKQGTCNVNTGSFSWTYSYNTVQDVLYPTADYFPNQNSV